MYTVQHTRKYGRPNNSAVPATLPTSGQTPGPPRPRTKDPMRGIPHIDKQVYYWFGSDYLINFWASPNGNVIEK